MELVVSSQTTRERPRRKVGLIIKIIRLITNIPNPIIIGGRM